MYGNTGTHVTNIWKSPSYDETKRRINAIFLSSLFFSVTTRDDAANADNDDHDDDDGENDALTD